MLSLQQSFATAAMQQLAAAAPLNTALMGVFARILSGQVELNDEGVPVGKGAFNTLLQVFTFVATPTHERPASPLAYNATQVQDALNQAREAVGTPAEPVIPPVAPDLLAAAQALSSVIAGVDQSSLLPSQHLVVRALDSNFHWPTASISYAFNETLPAEYTEPQDRHGWQPLAPEHRDRVHQVMQQLNEQLALDIHFSNQPSQASIRFNLVEMLNEETAAYAYLPNQGGWEDGDVFLSHTLGGAGENDGMGAFEYGLFTTVHEIGHALGLEHPFEGDAILPKAEDHRVHSVMSYTDYRDILPVFTLEVQNGSSNVGWQSGGLYPDAMMVYDLAALHSLYGANMNTAVGDTVYTFGADPFYRTIWDAGGYDVLDLRATTAFNEIDLTPGGYSSINLRGLETQIAEQQLIYQQALDTDHYDAWVRGVFEDHAEQLYTGEKNLGIAYGTVIEKVIGGDFGNVMRDNAVDNHLIGGAGNDRFILGAGGFNRIEGGAGEDSVYLPNSTKASVQLQAYEQGWLLVAESFAAHLTGISQIEFSDTTQLLV